MKLPRPLSAWLPPLAYMLFIFFLSAQETIPSVIQPLLVFLKDKTLHAIEYGVLALLVFRAARMQFPRACVVRVAVLAAAFAMLYGLSDEWHQVYVPNRDASLGDLLADAAGAALAAGACLAWYKRRHGSIHACSVDLKPATRD